MSHNRVTLWCDIHIANNLAPDLFPDTVISVRNDVRASEVAWWHHLVTPGFVLLEELIAPRDSVFDWTWGDMATGL